MRSCPCCSRDGHLENDMSTYMRPLDTPLFLYTAAHTRIEFLWILFSCAIRGPRHESINWWEMVVGCTHRRLSKGPASKAVRGLWLLVGVVSQVSKWSAFSTDNWLTLRKKRRGRKHSEKIIWEVRLWSSHIRTLDPLSTNAQMHKCHNLLPLWLQVSTFHFFH